MANKTNSQTFTLVADRIRRFTISLMNFPVNITLILLLNLQTVSINFIPRFKIRGVLRQRISKILTKGLAKLNLRNTMYMYAGVILLNIVPKITFKVISIFDSHLNIDITPKILYRLLTNVNNGFIQMNITAITAILKKLSEFDPQTLSTLDSLTLAQMDHT